MSDEKKVEVNKKRKVETREVQITVYMGLPNSRIQRVVKAAKEFLILFKGYSRTEDEAVTKSVLLMEVAINKIIEQHRAVIIDNDEAVYALAQLAGAYPILSLACPRNADSGRSLAALGKVLFHERLEDFSTFDMGPSVAELD